jgi:hypothetical protein
MIDRPKSFSHYQEHSMLITMDFLDQDTNMSHNQFQTKQISLNNHNKLNNFSCEQNVNILRKKW